ncbi:lysophosphatidic acid receptor 4-like [Clarias gariepinus]|uniref:lysophosphatidic acid receptor 4-like n=1 Tax=Clarias gariepinus TaxID=13013 RepID=UPI00234D6FD0|nr:lysophosphatidic acid receptor 4-like [Clarias gariepinus]
MGFASKKSSSSSPSSNSTQVTDWDFYNWCIDFETAIQTFSAISVFCFLLGLPACLWVLHELFQRKKQRSTSDIFMLCLTVIDLAFTIQMPISVCNLIQWHIVELQYILVFIYSFCLIGRPLFMACICLDCYIAVVHPIVYKISKMLTIVKKALTLTTCFLMATGGLLMCIVTRLITTPFLAIPLVVALPVITFCDISILLALRKPDPTGNNNIHPQKKQALHTIFNSFIMTCVVYLPPTIIFSFGSLFSLTNIEHFCFLSTCGLCFSTVGCVIMPVLYLFNVGKLDTFRNWFNR